MTQKERSSCPGLDSETADWPAAPCRVAIEAAASSTRKPVTTAARMRAADACLILKEYLDCQLADPRVGCTGNAAERSGGHAGGGVVEVRVVQYVEELGAELDRKRSRNEKFLKMPLSQVKEPGPIQGVFADVPLRCRSR